MFVISVKVLVIFFMLFFSISSYIVSLIKPWEKNYDIFAEKVV